jgi:hypothetical protein
MTATNDITGDKLATKPSSRYRLNYDEIDWGSTGQTRWAPKREPFSHKKAGEIHPTLNSFDPKI